MHLRRIFAYLSLVLALGLSGCAKENTAGALKRDSFTKNLVPRTWEGKGWNFAVELNDLQVSMKIDPASGEIVETPSLKGRYRITNTSKGLMEVETVTLEYMDERARPLAFKSGEKMAKVPLFLQALKPGDTCEGPLDVAMPRAAVEKLRKIDVNLAYVLAPLRQETLTAPQKVE